MGHLTCGTCYETFTTRSFFKIHMDTAHLENKPYRCNGCGKGYSHRNTAIYHLRRHCPHSTVTKVAIDQQPATYPSITVGIPLPHSSTYADG